MKRLDERAPGERPYRGYIAPCPRCGVRVVHSNKYDMPMHMHWRSKKCLEGAKKK